MSGVVEAHLETEGAGAMKPQIPHTRKATFKDRPVEKDDQGVPRFLENRVVRHLLDEASQGHKCDLNQLWYLCGCMHRFTQAEMREFYQLIGYSTDGYGEIFTSDEVWNDDVFDDVVADDDDDESEEN